METPPVTTEHGFAAIVESVKNGAQESLERLLDETRQLGKSSPGLRETELGLWSRLLEVGRSLVALALAEQCRLSTERDLEACGLSWDEVRLRLDADYWARLTTTLGPVFFPLFAYRVLRAGAWVTRVPARSAVLALYPRCRSSELCLEWETRLGKDFPFRRAQQMLSFFTHEAVSLEDTTIAAHMATVGKLVDPSWLYRTPGEIRTLLSERATRDRETGRPLVYFSTDAHALRRFVDSTWTAAWKMANGLRLWCVDRHTGTVIHLGGEYTWGDCNQVGAIVERLIASGILPPDGDYGEELVAQLVVVTDGLEWIENHVVARLPWAVVILDIYHVLEHLGEFAAACFGKATAQARRWLTGAKEVIFGRRTVAHRPTATLRRGQRRPRHAPARRPEDTTAVAAPEVHAGKELVLELLATHERLVDGRHYEAFDDLIRYLDNNTHRTDYRRYRHRGLQIGSGAMESLHRIASQLRLKVPGPGWLAESAQAIFNLRMLDLVGHWNKFWERPDLTDFLTQAFDNEEEAA